MVKKSRRGYSSTQWRRQSLRLTAPSTAVQYRLREGTSDQGIVLRKALVMPVAAFAIAGFGATDRCGTRHGRSHRGAERGDGQEEKGRPDEEARLPQQGLPTRSSSST